MNSLIRNQKALTDALIKEGQKAARCQCGRVLDNEFEVEFYNAAGECASCDHLRTDTFFDEPVGEEAK